MDGIDVVYGDTDLVPSGGITGGSRSVQVAGSALANASSKLVELGRSRAADRLEAAGDDVVFDRTAGVVISAAELPSFELVHMETPTFVNELGAKGIGESGTIGSIPAVHNAVIDALGHLGVRHIDMPLTPERIWRAVRSAGVTADR